MLQDHFMHPANYTSVFGIPVYFQVPKPALYLVNRVRIGASEYGSKIGDEPRSSKVNDYPLHLGPPASLRPFPNILVEKITQSRAPRGNIIKNKARQSIANRWGN